MAVLVYYQFGSAPDSFINKNVVDDTFVFRVVGDIVRTTGTFSFTAGYSLFVVSVVAIVAASWTVRTRCAFAARVQPVRDFDYRCELKCSTPNQRNSGRLDPAR